MPDVVTPPMTDTPDDSSLPTYNPGPYPGGNTAERGFTIVEPMFVIVVFAILASVVTLGYRGVR